MIWSITMPSLLHENYQFLAGLKKVRTRARRIQIVSAPLCRFTAGCTLVRSNYMCALAYYSPDSLGYVYAVVGILRGGGDQSTGAHEPTIPSSLRRFFVNGERR